MLAKLARGIVDVGDSVIDDIDSPPDSDSAAVPMLNFESSYTFVESRTQNYVGNLLEDFLSFDLYALAGIHQDMKSAGIFSFAVIGTSLSADVWQDPYQTGVKRKDTERSGSGYRVSWERLFNSGLATQFSSKKIDIDDERNGKGLGLSQDERGLLNRNGDLNQLELGYEFQLSGGRHILTPSLVYHDAAMDVGAMAHDGCGASLNYIYLHSDRWRWVFNLGYRNCEYDGVNPVYGVKDDADNYGASATVFYSAPFG
jgi:hypothetical protein